MIEIYTSENNYLSLGNGKTLRMVTDGWHFKQNKPKFKVFTNFDCSYADEQFKIDDLIDIIRNNEECLLLIDEIDILLDAYDSFSKSSKKAKKFFKQPRKRRMYIKTATQSYNDIQAHIRRKNPVIYAMRKVHFDNTLCWASINADCSYTTHFYQKHLIRFYGNTIISEHLKPDTTGHRVDLIADEETGENHFILHEDFFHNMYNTDELILLESD